MANIELLQIGCTGQQLLDTINALVAAHNNGENEQNTSYEDMDDTPTVNGVPFIGAMTTASMLVKFSELADYETWEAALATKNYVDAIETAAVNAAQSAVQAALANKLDKDLSNLEAAEYVGNDAYVLVLTPNNRLLRMSIASMAAYVDTQARAGQNAVNTAIANERRVLTITGDQDGHNVVYTVTGGYKTGTSTLYLNGQLLAEGRDYEETDTQTITLLTYIPEADDVLIFRAIPLGTSRV